MKGIIMPIYSFGLDSILKVELTEEQADGYNRFQAAFFEAQTKLRDAGTPWVPTEPLSIDALEGDGEIYNEVAGLINDAIDKIDQKKTPIGLGEDYLIKN